MKIRPTHAFLFALTLAAAAAQAQSTPFRVSTFNTDSAGAMAFVTGAGREATPRLCILDGMELRIYPSLDSPEPYSITFRPGTSAFDVYDLDEDGEDEVIAIEGDSIVAYRPSASGHQPHEILFRVPNRLSDTEASPYPYVLAARYEERNILAIPRDAGLELRTADGNVVGTFPLEARREPALSIGHSFTYWTGNSITDPSRALFEMHVVSHIEGAPTLPESLAGSFSSQTLPRASWTQLRDASGLDPELWPWLPLRKGKSADRAFVALSPPNFRDTVICIRKPTSRLQQEKQRSFVVGPKRNYPGIVVFPTAGAPDFNGDTYTDLVLWKTPIPGHSLGSILRVAQSGKWTVELTVHLYSPERGRYEARPAGRIRLSVPVTWILAPRRGVPLRNLTFVDFNGDGRDDIGCNSTGDRYEAWLFKDGFTSEPTHWAKLPETGTQRILEADLTGSGEISIVLKGAKAYYVLTPPQKSE